MEAGGRHLEAAQRSAALKEILLFLFVVVFYFTYKFCPLRILVVFSTFASKLQEDICMHCIWSCVYSEQSGERAGPSVISTPPNMHFATEEQY